MNIPNKLTMLRIILIPFFVFFMLSGICDWFKWVALGIFVVASLTDFADGKIARKRKLITTFGKFMDPVADKLLVAAALICFVDLGLIPTWVVIVIISREFIVSGFRLVAAEKGVVLSAGFWGKLKTATQMVMTVWLIASIPGDFFFIVGQILIYMSLALTIISMTDYIWNNRRLLSGGL